MRLAGIDFETTGLDTGNDRIIEAGVVLYDTDLKAPVQLYSQFIYDESLEVFFNEETLQTMQRVSGITPSLLREFGHHPKTALMDIGALVARADYIVAHNGESFDKPILMAELARHGVDNCLRTKPWLDTKEDIPYDVPPESNRLRHLALDQGFINPFEHRAVFDVLTMMKVLSKHDIQAIIEYSKIPWIIVRAMVSYDDRQLAKDQRFSWERIGDRNYPKQWVKRIKENKLSEVQKACKFTVVRIE